MSKTKKSVVVSRKFLTRLADKIYNPKTKKYIPLCTGQLQSSVPINEEVTQLHCGLGELYYAMTGKEPKDDLVNTGGVIDVAVANSTFEGARKKEISKAVKLIRALPLAKEIRAELSSVAENVVTMASEEVENDFRQALDDIVTANDDGGSYSPKSFEKRAKRVAAQIRHAASLLPE